MSPSPRRIYILGSTGSIGRQTLDVVARHPGAFDVVGLAAGTRVTALLEQARDHGVRAVGVTGESAGTELRGGVSGLQTAVGMDEICAQMVSLKPDLVVAAMSGVVGLIPVMAAVSAGLDVALANKEPLVAAGELVTGTAARTGSRLIPVDSEISAVFQCLEGPSRPYLKRVLLTASGGAFRDLSREELARVTPEQALNHPTWNMGPKITVDSATLANKGFEVFELKWLFDLDFSDIEVLIHHQSIIHSLVEFVDGSILAQMSLPDMRFAIQYALTWPERVASDYPRLDLAQVGSLTFGQPDLVKFPCLRLAFDAGKAGRSYPVALNAANEEAVDLFLSRRIGFTTIPELVERALDEHDPADVKSLDTVLAVDADTRKRVRELVKSDRYV
ncbi:MAG: 1-deoxy-D-xylulose-5-phosphate reductoisomerase [Armatimonadetes bacterium]|nr:1-deoxy-D-xylulose-5-phosphate reductoisomerase [Armatimonadota bacterium]